MRSPKWTGSAKAIKAGDTFEFTYNGSTGIFEIKVYEKTYTSIKYLQQKFFKQGVIPFVMMSAIGNQVTLNPE